MIFFIDFGLSVFGAVQTAQCKWRNASGLGLGLGSGLGLGFAICVAPLALRHLHCAVCIAPNTLSRSYRRGQEFHWGPVIQQLET